MTEQLPISGLIPEPKPLHSSETPPTTPSEKKSPTEEHFEKLYGPVPPPSKLQKEIIKDILRKINQTPEQKAEEEAQKNLSNYPYNQE